MKSIYPSLISADLLNLEREIKLLEPYCQGYHFDVMDDHFVPNLTWGKMFIDQIVKVTAKPLWVHLMIDKPSIFVESIVLNANSMLTFHIESIGDVKNFSIRIKDKNMLPGVAVSPKTPVEKIFQFLDLLDHILIMTVEPGFSGQDFLPESIDKIRSLFSYCKINGHKVKIAVDGGVSKNNIAMLAKEGVDIFSVGTAIFGQVDPVGAIRDLQELINK